jgi:hypothetical protein
MKKYLILSALMLVAGLTACEHKALCEDHREHAHKYHIKIVADYRYDWEEYGEKDWEENWPENYLPYDDLRPGKPSGLRVVNYNEDGDFNLHNIKPEGGVVMLYEGVNDLLFYNNDTEYIIFSRSGDGGELRATTRTRSRATYMDSTYTNEGEKLVAPPDMLYANVYNDYVAEKVVDPTEVKVTLQPLVFTYKIRYEFAEGLKYVSMASGELSGMAKDVELHTGETSQESVIIGYDCEVTEYGVRALVKSFGVPAYPHPNYPTRTEVKHGLNLRVIMRNGQTKNFNFDVTDQIKAQPHGGVIVVKDIVIKDDEGTQGSGGFDVEVDDWGDYEDIPLPL